MQPLQLIALTVSWVLILAPRVVTKTRPGGEETFGDGISAIDAATRLALAMAIFATRCGRGRTAASSRARSSRRPGCS